MAYELERTFAREEILDPAPITLAKALSVAARLPLPVLTALWRLRCGTDVKLGIVLLRNVPVDRYIPTQPQPTRLLFKKRTCISEALYLVIHVAADGVPISYIQENAGDTVATLYPKPEDA